MCVRPVNESGTVLAPLLQISPRCADASSRCAAPVVIKVGSGSVACGGLVRQPAGGHPVVCARPRPLYFRRAEDDAICAERSAGGWVALRGPACQPNRRRVTTRNRKLTRRVDACRLRLPGGRNCWQCRGVGLRSIWDSGYETCVAFQCCAEDG